MAQLFIAERKLPAHAVRYITSRDYDLNQESKAYDLTDFYNYLEEVSKFNKVFNLGRKIKILDSQIKTLVNHQFFTLYIPQFNHSLFQILASHNLCKNSVLVEEGITSYKLDKALYAPTKLGTVQFLSWIFTKRFIPQNNHYTPYPLKKFKYAIAVSEDCFPYLENKKIVSLNKNAVSNYVPVIKDEAVVFVLDSFKERTMISDQEYFVIIEETLNLFKVQEAKLLVKFHPEQSEEMRQKTISFIRGLLKFESVDCLNDNCILELEFLKSRDLVVIGMHTSLLYYAKEFGHRVLSGIKTTSKNPKINTYINHIMDKEQREIYRGYE